MIDIIKQTPIEYSAQSRDYQVLARLYTALFNISKMYIDDLGIWTEDIDNKLTTLRAKTLNFNALHSWSEDDLEAVTSCFKYLIRSKGVLKTIEQCINILMKVQGIVGENIDDAVSIDNYILTIRVPGDLLTIGILEDLLKYILPIGLNFNIVKYLTAKLSRTAVTEVAYGDNPLWHKQEPYDNKMYIGTSYNKSKNYRMQYIDFKKDAKYWAGLDNKNYKPENDEGFDHAWLISDETPSKNYYISKDDGSETKVWIGLPKDQENDVKYITDTFIYVKKDVEEGGEKVYHEEWEEE